MQTPLLNHVFPPCLWFWRGSGEALWGCGALRVDLHFLLREACYRVVASSPNSGTTLACLLFRGTPTLHLEM